LALLLDLDVDLGKKGGEKLRFYGKSGEKVKVFE
jgi:hypothetical protein